MALPKLLQKLFTNGGAGDKLNQDIIPDIPYSKITDAPSVDSALSSTSENPVQNKVINSALNGKLSTSGGTMTGDIIFSSSATKIANAQNKGGKVEVSETGAALLSNKDDYEGGATLLLRSSTYYNDQKGYFYLISALSASQRHDLVGKPDGSLTWDGHEVARVVSSGKSAYGTQWYRKYNDGYIEQAGLFDYGSDASVIGGIITFLAPFSSSVYSVQVTPGATQDTDWAGYVITQNHTTTSMSITFWSKGSTRVRYLYWFACGY